MPVDMMSRWQLLHDWLVCLAWYHVLHRQQSVYNIVWSTEMARPEGWKSEAQRAQKGCWVLGEGMFPSRPATESGYHYKLPIGAWGKVRRPGDLERFIGLQAYLAAPGVDFAGIKFVSVKFSWGSKP